MFMRGKYVPKEELKQELLEVLYTKETVSKIKARQLIYYGVPMSLIRWARYLTVEEAGKYLKPEDVATQDNTAEMNEEDLGL